MRWYQVWLSDYQPEPFMVKADSREEAGRKTLDWAMKEYPGMFEFNVEYGGWMLKDQRAVAIGEVVHWQ